MEPEAGNEVKETEGQPTRFKSTFMAVARETKNHKHHRGWTKDYLAFPERAKLLKQFKLPFYEQLGSSSLLPDISGFSNTKNVTGFSWSQPRNDGGVRKLKSSRSN